MWKQIHSGDNGNLSWLRVSSSFVITVIMITYITTNIISLSRDKGAVDFGTNALYIITALLIAKVSTKQIERKDDKEINS